MSTHICLLSAVPALSMMRFWLIVQSYTLSAFMNEWMIKKKRHGYVDVCEVYNTNICLLVICFFFVCFLQILPTTSVENRGECSLNTSRPSLDVWDGSSSLYPLYHPVSEGWIRRTRWKQSEHQSSLLFFLRREIVILTHQFKQER